MVVTAGAGGEAEATTLRPGAGSARIRRRETAAA